MISNLLKHQGIFAPSARAAGVAPLAWGEGSVRGVWVGSPNAVQTEVEVKALGRRLPARRFFFSSQQN